MKILYQAVLAALTLLLWLKAALDSVRRWFRRKPTPSVGKRPRHLAVVLQHAEPIVLAELQCAVDACVAMNVDQLTLYDAHGRCKAFAEQLVSAQTVVHCDGALHSSSKAASDHAVHVQLLDRANSRGVLVAAAKELATATLSGLIQPKAIDEARVNALVRKQRHGFDEPELLLICGPMQRLDGFEPWDIRLTEICHSVGPFLTAAALDEAFAQFDQCQQRFGK